VEILARTKPCARLRRDPFHPKHPEARCRTISDTQVSPQHPLPSSIHCAKPRCRIIVLCAAAAGVISWYPRRASIRRRVPARAKRAYLTTRSSGSVDSVAVSPQPMLSSCKCVNSQGSFTGIPKTSAPVAIETSKSVFPGHRRIFAAGE